MLGEMFAIKNLNRVHNTHNGIPQTLRHGEKIIDWINSKTKVEPLYCFFLDTPVSSTKKIDGHDITEILFKMALSNVTLTQIRVCFEFYSIKNSSVF